MPPPSRLEKLSPLALRKGGETRRGGGRKLCSLESNKHQNREISRFARETISVIDTHTHRPIHKFPNCVGK